MSHTINDETPAVSSHSPVTHILVETKKYYCPFLERGFCRESTQCNFSHDNHVSTKIPINYCHFYLANKCLYGIDCKFVHSEPSDEHSLLTIFANINFNGSDYEEDADETFSPAGEGSSSNYDYDYNETIANDPADSNASHIADEKEEDGFICEQEHFSGDSTDYHPDATSEGPQNSNQNNPPPLRPKMTISQRYANTRSQQSNVPSSSSNAIASSKPSKNWQGARLIASIRNNCSFSIDVDANASSSKDIDDENTAGNKNLPLCPYSLASALGECPFPAGRCNYLHGLVCDLCYSPCLHPYDEDQRRQHRDDCLHEHEREMELSFAVQRSSDKVCGICMDTVVEKKPITASRFGILEKCNHIFCLDCIRKWRGTKQFDNRTVRACPECRVSSDFVVPSKYWVEDQDDKDKLINDYKAALKSKPCRYFNEGKGDCPFAGSCFYKHAYPDGRLAVVDASKPRRRLYGARGSASVVTNYILWNLLTSTDEDNLTNEDDPESSFHYNDDFYDPTDDEDFDDQDWI